jgi:hypothetical protein
VDVVARAERDAKREKRREKALRASGMVTESNATATSEKTAE